MSGWHLFAMFRPTPVTPPTASPPSLDRRNSDPCRPAASSVQPMSASSLLARMVAVATRQTPVRQQDLPSPVITDCHEEKLEWETLSRRGSDPSQCGYISFPDFDRLSRSTSHHDDDDSASH